jgi:bifunctional DNase/RNase
MIQVELLGVRVEPPSNTPAVHLRELQPTRRRLSIFIGGHEATAIALALEGVSTPRPLTHDLLCNVLDELGAELTRVVITEIRETTYYAELHLDLDDDVLLVSARPSDALALAVRVGCPIFVEDAVMEQGGFAETEDELEEPSNPDEVVAEFREFIDSISPEDFESGS